MVCLINTRITHAYGKKIFQILYQATVPCSVIFKWNRVNSVSPTNYYYNEHVNDFPIIKDCVCVKIQHWNENLSPSIFTFSD